MVVADFEIESVAGLSGDEGVRLSTGRTAGPVFSWFDVRAKIGGTFTEVDFVWRTAVESHVRPMLIIPFQKG